MSIIINLVIALIILGFLYWAWLQIAPLIARFVAEPFMGVINIIVLIAFAAVALFYIIIPLLRWAAAHLPALG